MNNVAELYLEMSDRSEDLIIERPEGLYCPAGDFYIDPLKSVDRAVITHAHSDHARAGSAAYLCSHPSLPLLRKRVGANASIEAIPYGKAIRIKDASLSLHPAGHILGSAQVRVEVEGRVWVVSGDYNLQSDFATGAPFEAIPCETFITESTFALPVYRWPSPRAVYSEILEWWKRNQKEELVSVIPAYPLGKSQRLLAHLDPEIGPIAVLGNARDFIDAYREAGIRQVDTLSVNSRTIPLLRGKGLVLTSGSEQEERSLLQLGPASRAFASGWMATRAARRSRGYDCGFVLSDHADWEGILSAIRATGADRIGVMHGETELLARWLRENGWDAFELSKKFIREAE